MNHKQKRAFFQLVVAQLPVKDILRVFQQATLSTEVATELHNVTNFIQSLSDETKADGTAREGCDKSILECLLQRSVEIEDYLITRFSCEVYNKKFTRADFAPVSVQQRVLQKHGSGMALLFPVQLKLESYLLDSILAHSNHLSVIELTNLIYAAVKTSTVAAS